MSKQKTALNSRKGGGKKKPGAAGARSGAGTGTPRRTEAALSAKSRKNAKAAGPTSAEKRHAGIGRG